MKIGPADLVEVSLIALMPKELAEEIKQQQEQHGLSDAEWITAAGHALARLYKQQATAAKARAAIGTNNATPKKRAYKKRGKK